MQTCCNDLLRQRIIITPGVKTVLASRLDVVTSRPVHPARYLYLLVAFIICTLLGGGPALTGAGPTQGELSPIWRFAFRALRT